MDFDDFFRTFVDIPDKFLNFFETSSKSLGDFLIEFRNCKFQHDLAIQSYITHQEEVAQLMELRKHVISEFFRYRSSDQPLTYDELVFLNNLASLDLRLPQSAEFFQPTKLTNGDSSKRSYIECSGEEYKIEK